MDLLTDQLIDSFNGQTLKYFCDKFCIQSSNVCLKLSPNALLVDKIREDLLLAFI